MNADRTKKGTEGKSPVTQCLKLDSSGIQCEKLARLKFHGGIL